MLTKILFYTLIGTGFLLIGSYFYLAGWLVPRYSDDKAKRKRLGWLAMLIISTAVFLFSLAFMIRDPIIIEFVPVFLILSIFVGLLARSSAISSYELADFWSKFGKKQIKVAKAKYEINRKYSLHDIPEFIRFQEANPHNEIDEKLCAITYGRAIHWMSFIQILWPDFKQTNQYIVEVRSLVINDPDESRLPEEWFHQMAQTIAMFWRIQLEDLYPTKDWKVVIGDNPEITVEAIIRSQ